MEVNSEQQHSYEDAYAAAFLMRRQERSDTPRDIHTHLLSSINYVQLLLGTYK